MPNARRKPRSNCAVLAKPLSCATHFTGASLSANARTASRSRIPSFQSRNPRPVARRTRRPRCAGSIPNSRASVASRIPPLSLPAICSRSMARAVLGVLTCDASAGGRSCRGGWLECSTPSLAAAPRPRSACAQAMKSGTLRLESRSAVINSLGFSATAPVVVVTELSELKNACGNAALRQAIDGATRGEERRTCWGGARTV